MEVTQFTYFQQVGGFECNPVPVEIAYGLERLDDVHPGGQHVRHRVEPRRRRRELHLRRRVLENERQYSRYNFEVADTDFLFQEFNDREAECLRTLEAACRCRPTTACWKCCHASTCSLTRAA